MSCSRRSLAGGVHPVVPGALHQQVGRTSSLRQRPVALMTDTIATLRVALQPDQRRACGTASTRSTSFAQWRGPGRCGRLLRRAVIAGKCAPLLQPAGAAGLVLMDHLAARLAAIDACIARTGCSQSGRRQAHHQRAVQGKAPFHMAHTCSSSQDVPIHPHPAVRLRRAGAGRTCHGGRSSPACSVSVSSRPPGAYLGHCRLCDHWQHQGPCSALR